ncbi:hypothetical protein [Candidatus Accumulibacter sp. ACC012]|uniref:hypothetical protein n=1 Tax=Candidatus Accumulibacter sp. ACC012 TaxID=2823332 RepID=UPI0025BA4B86|nr:hypothetical protein [Candidatus Accumulibacter sp. ACC012]
MQFFKTVLMALALIVSGLSNPFSPGIRIPCSSLYRAMRHGGLATFCILPSFNAPEDTR